LGGRSVLLRLQAPIAIDDTQADGAYVFCRGFTVKGGLLAVLN
jgi:hypothetical protein